MICQLCKREARVVHADCGVYSECDCGQITSLAGDETGFPVGFDGMYDDAAWRAWLTSPPYPIARIFH